MIIALATLLRLLVLFVADMWLHSDAGGHSLRRVWTRIALKGSPG